MHRRLENTEEKEKFIKTLKNQYSHQLLVVVCDDSTAHNDDYYINMFHNEEKNKLVIVIEKRANDEIYANLLLEDIVCYEHQSPESKENVLSKVVSFQGYDKTL